jgi:hypothetical protein
MADAEKISKSEPIETYSDYKGHEGSSSNYTPPTHVENTSPYGIPPAKVAQTLADVAHISEHEARLRLGLPVLGMAPHAEHGELIDHEGEHDDGEYNPNLAWAKFRRSIREPLAEFFGVFIMILFGDGVVAQVVLSGGEKGSYQSISWGWGFVLLLIHDLRLY